jgi:hypothetical protein
MIRISVFFIFVSSVSCYQTSTRMLPVMALASVDTSGKHSATVVQLHGEKRTGWLLGSDATQVPAGTE